MIFMPVHTVWVKCVFPSVCLQDSVLAFWKHGLKGKSFHSNEVRRKMVHVYSSWFQAFLLHFCFVLFRRLLKRSQMRAGCSEFWVQTGTSTLNWSDKSERCLSCKIISRFSFLRDIILQSTPTDEPSALSNLYILTGHESSYWGETKGQRLPSWNGKCSVWSDFSFTEAVEAQTSHSDCLLLLPTRDRVTEIKWNMHVWIEQHGLLGYLSLEKELELECNNTICKKIDRQGVLKVGATETEQMWFSTPALEQDRTLKMDNYFSIFTEVWLKHPNNT